MEPFFNSNNLVDILFRWKIHLAIIMVLAVVLSVILSSPMVITPLYKSYAVVYPSNVAPYSDENETEQMIEILNSGDIRDNVIQKFDLAAHWNVDSSYKYFISTLYWIYSQRVKISKTPNEAVNIVVMDPDPRMACDMVIAILDFYNVKVRRLHKDKFYEVVINYETIVNEKKMKIDSLRQRAEELGTKYGLMEYQAQTREVMRALLGTGSQSGRYNEALKYKKNIEEKGAEMLLIQEMMAAETEEFAVFKLDYDRALLDYNREYTHLNLLTKPFVSDKKSYPIRWLIVVGSVLAIVFLALIVIGVIERNRYTKHFPA
ncbi:MAG: Wzz/FepE/Etk N-terminal domain-containing protein [Bacteroidota bacterium]